MDAMASVMDQTTSPRARISLPPRVASAGPGLRSGVVNCAAYEGGVRVADVEVADVRDVLQAHPGRFVWIGMYEPNEDLLREVQREFNLHDLAVEDAHNAHQRPKFEVYDDSLFVVLRTAQMSGSPAHIQFGETHVFVGTNTSSRCGTDRSCRTSGCGPAASRRPASWRKAPASCSTR